VAGGRLTVVGTGFLVAGQATPEARACMRAADRLLFLVAEPATRLWLQSEFPRAQSMADSFWEGRPRLEAYEEVVGRILAPLREGMNVCAAFYGHPGVFVHSSHEAVRRARAEGFAAEMLPGVSAEDCLFADLGVDPALHGCQSFEASSFLLRRRKVDPSAALVLWQIGALGVSTYSTRTLWNRDGLDLLVEALLEVYPAEHEAVVYEATLLPVCDPLIQRVPVARIAETKVSTYSTLYVPPARQAPLDEAMLARLGLAAAPDAASSEGAER
jgi:uncharacterized protein YabN with tetrapyrrole methylase and pyrophosphatase domain